MLRLVHLFPHGIRLKFGTVRRHTFSHCARARLSPAALTSLSFVSSFNRTRNRPLSTLLCSRYWRLQKQAWRLSDILHGAKFRSVQARCNASKARLNGTPSFENDGSERKHGHTLEPLGSSQEKEYVLSQEEARYLVQSYSFEQSKWSKDDSNRNQGSLPSVDSNNGYLEKSKATFSGQSHKNVGPSEHVRQKVAHLDRLIQFQSSSKAAAYKAYQSLPNPRTSNLSDRTLNRFLSHLALVQRKTDKSMLRYLSIVDEAASLNRHISLRNWNSAISFAGRCLKLVTQRQVDSALQLWREMEQNAGVQSNHVTLNILFDIATKAGKFVFAEMILKEMQARSLPLSRYLRTGLIFHYGLRRDSQNVRKAYIDLTDANEIVDTVVLNCVIVSLIRCGEAVAAVQIFEGMKNLHAEKMNSQPSPSRYDDWRENKFVGNTLERAAYDLRAAGGPLTTGNDASPSSAQLAYEMLKRKTSVAPNLETYRVLIEYHALEAGDIEYCARLVDEMEGYGIKLHGTIFLTLFKAFAKHGGIVYTQWTRRRLEMTWAAFSKALDNMNSHDRQDYKEMEEGRKEAFEEDKQEASPGSSFFIPHAPVDSDSHPRNTNESAPYSVGGNFPSTSQDIENEPDETAPLQQDSSQPSAELRKRIYLSRPLVQLIGKAFAKCSTSKRTAEVWLDLQSRWWKQWEYQQRQRAKSLASLESTSDYHFESLSTKNHDDARESAERDFKYSIEDVSKSGLEDYDGDLDFDLEETDNISEAEISDSMRQVENVIAWCFNAEDQDTFREHIDHLEQVGQYEGRSE